MNHILENLVLATHNPGKALEIEALLKPYVKIFYTAADLNLPEPEETGDSFTANAVLKAEAAARISGQPALADDSGLSVTALNGAPGIYSARWGGPDKDFGQAMARVHKELENHQDHSAAFTCVLALAFPDGKTLNFEGQVHGQISWPPRGDFGFGYDPIFVPDGYDMTFAQMSSEDKYKISHRTQAFEKMVETVFKSQKS